MGDAPVEQSVVRNGKEIKKQAPTTSEGLQQYRQQKREQLKQKRAQVMAGRAKKAVANIPPEAPAGKLAEVLVETAQVERSAGIASRPGPDLTAQVPAQPEPEPAVQKQRGPGEIGQAAAQPQGSAEQQPDQESVQEATPAPPGAIPKSADARASIPGNEPPKGPDANSGPQRQGEEGMTVPPSPAGNPPEGSQSTGSAQSEGQGLTPPLNTDTTAASQQQPTSEDPTVNRAQNEQERLNALHQGVNLDAEADLQANDPVYKGLKEQLDKVEGNDSQANQKRQQIQAQLDKMLDKKRKEIAEGRVDPANLDSIRVVARLNRPEKGPLSRFLKTLKERYAGVTDKAPIVEARSRATDLMRRYWQMRNDHSEKATKEKAIMWQGIKDDLKTYGILRLKKFAFKDYPLLVLATTLLLLLGVIYTLHKLSGGK